MEYTPPNKNFEGFLKLIKDPNIEYLNSENILHRGSFVRVSSWVFAMVIYVGMDN